MAVTADKGRGVLASRDIRMGELLLLQPPLAIIQASNQTRVM